MGQGIVPDGVFTTTTNYTTLGINYDAVISFERNTINGDRIGIRTVGVKVTRHQIEIFAGTIVVLLITTPLTRPGISGGPANTGSSICSRSTDIGGKRISRTISTLKVVPNSRSEDSGRAIHIRSTTIRFLGRKVDCQTARLQ